MRKLAIVFIITSLLALTGCSKTTITRAGPKQLNRHSNWMVFPFANLTETPDAGSRAKVITANLLQIKGPQSVQQYAKPRSKKQLLQVAEQPLTKPQVMSYAMHHHINYAVVGSVTEWRYKVGLDGEPSVGLTMQVIEIPTGKIIWSAVGSKVGSSRSGLGQTAQTLIAKLIKGMPRFV